MKKLLAIILFSIITTSFTGCATDTAQLPYYKAGEEKGQTYVEQSNVGIADFYAQDLTIIPSDELQEDNNIAATSSLLINNTENEVIYADDIYKKMYPASITKIVTALVVLENGNLDDTVTISKNASNITEVGAKLCGFKEGDTISLESLLNIFLIYSGNDAGIAIAEHISGSEEAFAEEMTQAARKLGAVHSNFVNSHGLHDEEHYTTAYDLYLIFNELLKHEEFISIIHKSSVTADYVQADGTTKSHQYMNTNRYLLGKTSAPDNITVIGGKTGTTNAAGSCLILYSIDDKGNEYISVVLQAQGGNNLYKEMTYLLSMVE